MNIFTALTSCLVSTRGETIAHFFKALSLNFFFNVLVAVSSDFIPRCFDKILFINTLLHKSFFDEIMLAFVFGSVYKKNEVK